MRGLYFRKPWDELILYGFYDRKLSKYNKKIVEIRTYNINIREEVVVLGTKLDNDAYKFLSKRLDLPEKEALKRREHSVMGIVEFIDCKPLSYDEFVDLQDKHYNKLSWWNKKVHGLLLKNPRSVIPPIPYKPYGIRGQKFVKIPEKLEVDIVKRLEAAKSDSIF